ncbi:mitochondrial distribution and morphology protein [Aspergillus candidus]|uniref:Mitochondrial distribution and morphology protein-domain-containing protein n=1 Tax=Aspergillus candidus TaxID=41067 RepID=A0A2I2FM10_ASPCN|nr:mitochondrial distribution and morphology protein-domain-containing protein [Aspergillus candidus]PLB41662.1 mitochondrial distribution and morphology protein-domain-containing protein [Aspergillus candidus]
MTGNLGRRLYTNFWEAAHPLLGKGFQTAPASAASSGNFFCDFVLKNRLGKPPSFSLRKTHQYTRRFASGGFLVLGASPSTTAVETGTSCAIAPEKLLPSRRYQFDRKFFRSLSQTAARRGFHTSKDDRPPTEGSKDPLKNAPEDPQSTAPAGRRNEGSQSPGSDHPTAEQKHPTGYRFPQMPHIHRPSKEELLAAATGFWSRLKVRFKWFSIRSVRPYNLDEIAALFSWVFLGHVVWVVLGTTTFFSLIILTINTVFAQETLAGWIGNYLTKSSGVKVVFESAIVPRWRDGVITFRNVFVSRRPGQGTGNVSKGSSKTAAAAAAAAARSDHLIPDGPEQRTTAEDEDTNYTQFDVSIETVNVTLSFAKWLNGKGLLRDVEIQGVRGVLDRRSVFWPDEDLDPKSYRHEHSPGDFEIDSFKMNDLLLTVYQPDNFRPFSVSIFSCDLPQLRKQWLFYDFMSANMMSGAYDNSLFTIHPRQTHSFTGAQLDNGREEDGKPSPWKKHNRIRVDGLNIDHLNRGVPGPLSWIHEGQVDIVADMMIPADNDESLAKVMADFYDRLEATVTSNRFHSAADIAGRADEPVADEDKRFLVTDLRLHLNNVRAVVPIFTRDLSYINNALIRPIVAYINSRRTFIPVNCRLVKRAGDFNGSWTIYDSGLMDDLSAAVYDAFARDVVDEQARKRRFKKVGFWSLQLAAQAIFISMAGNIA